MPKVSFPITNDDDANAFLVADPLALVLGMLFDQQVPMEWAFRAPYTLSQRLGDRFTATDIAAMDPEDLVAVFVEKPALHRYPAAMARRAHAVCEHIVEHYKGDPANLWRRVGSGGRLTHGRSPRTSRSVRIVTRPPRMRMAWLPSRFRRRRSMVQRTAVQRRPTSKSATIMNTRPQSSASAAGSVGKAISRSPLPAFSR